MVMREAFRISLGPLQVDHPLHSNHQKELGYQRTIEQVLKPLKILGRLHFSRYSDAPENKDWLVVKIESSGQLALLEEFVQFEDQEMMRECDAAVDLARRALCVFRQLISLSCMTPTKFHAVLEEKGSELAEGFKLMKLAERGEGVVAIRDPQGHDDLARMYPTPRLVTLPEAEERQFSINMVGRLSALVYRVKDKSGELKPFGKKIPLHWGNGSTRAELVERYLAAMEAQMFVTIWTRETFDRKGKLSRLEWSPDPDMACPDYMLDSQPVGR